ncbi:hypothetical protein HanXRQr2_Chr16g0748151 [Helianthus annuus]|uniref:Uncharacterized protein n=1 Tax=Helianthus annuus TaxID=4232 RepID=A0A9K3DTH9_HELAN|nr:hypothetical protein HanXRQr2_Chr16g0748151 [Helianthus annuus]KAJ0821199.1 hypothetical protein HanPSC8_Chr16g0717191 [Helianthus annuus]
MNIKSPSSLSVSVHERIYFLNERTRTAASLIRVRSVRLQPYM